MLYLAETSLKMLVGRVDERNQFCRTQKIVWGSLTLFFERVKKNQVLVLVWIGMGVNKVINFEILPFWGCYIHLQKEKSTRQLKALLQIYFCKQFLKEKKKINTT